MAIGGIAMDRPAVRNAVAGDARPCDYSLLGRAATPRELARIKFTSGAWTARVP